MIYDQDEGHRRKAQFYCLRDPLLINLMPYKDRKRKIKRFLELKVPVEYDLYSYKIKSIKGIHKNKLYSKFERLENEKIR